MVLVAVRDLMFASKIDAAAKRLGVSVTWAPRDAPLSEAVRERGPTFVLADLGERGTMAELRAIRAESPGIRIVAFVGHLQTELIDEGRSIGIDEILTRGQLAASLDAVLLRASGVA